MLKFLTSLSFLYAFTIGILLLYGLVYYRDFVKIRLPAQKFSIRIPAYQRCLFFFSVF